MDFSPERVIGIDVNSTSTCVARLERSRRTGWSVARRPSFRGSANLGSIIEHLKPLMDLLLSSFWTASERPLLLMKSSEAKQVPLPTEHTEAERTLTAMSSWPADWNGHGAAPPPSGAIIHARALVRSYYDTCVRAKIAWIEPHVTASAMGAVVFEWWQGTRKLTIYVSHNSSDYVKVWGADIHSEMEDGDMGNFLPLWQWLNA